eukprot:TRINITY_DN104546_c0_g1_i1.p1 TRINITY_DN104546_c0_g1~~TRINITY_DN104546_c0_g1_i1.p1  ORF type:complete len:398 (+),score=91.07 TRINITY_DN104546_c0_g1_i1:86-1279(+)
MPQDELTLELTQGITWSTQRLMIKRSFERYGTVTACWLPPSESRNEFSKERGFVRFSKPEEAKAALEACNAGHVVCDSKRIYVDWKTSGARGPSSRGTGGHVSVLQEYCRKKPEARRARSPSEEPAEEKTEVATKQSQSSITYSQDLIRRFPVYGIGVSEEALNPGKRKNDDNSEESDNSSSKKKSKKKSKKDKKEKEDQLAIKDGGGDESASKHNEELETPWFAAVARANVQRCMRLLTGRADVNQTTSRGVCALHLAARKASAQVCAALLKAEADVNKAADDGNTALHYAAEAACAPACAALLHRRANVDTQNATGSTALHLAATAGAEAVYLLLGSAKAADDLPDRQGRTPAQLWVEAEARGALEAEQRQKLKERRTQQGKKTILDAEGPTVLD